MDTDEHRSLNKLYNDMLDFLVNQDILKQAAHDACVYGTVAHKTYLEDGKIKVEIVASRQE